MLPNFPPLSAVSSKSQNTSFIISNSKIIWSELIMHTFEAEFSMHQGNTHDVPVRNQHAKSRLWRQACTFCRIALQHFGLHKKTGRSIADRFARKYMHCCFLFKNALHFNDKQGGYMPDCAMMPNCLFFNDKMANMPTTANLMKRKYCQDNFSTCARYVVCKALGKEKVPADLTPSQMDKAKLLIR